MTRGAPFYLKEDFLAATPRYPVLVKRAVKRVFMDESGELRNATRYTLAALGAMGIIAIAVVAPGALYGMRALARTFRSSGNPYAKKLAKERRLTQILDRLHRQRFIEFQKTRGRKYRVQLTLKGKARLLSYTFEDLAIPVPPQWDGKWRLVIFDIPEHKRYARDALRDKLRRLGFFQIQKSAFVFPHSCLSEVDFVAELFGVWPYIVFLETNALGRQEAAIRRRFDLL